MTEHIQTYEWYAVVEPASKPNVAEPTASMTATKSDRDTILAKYRNLQKLHAAEHDQVKHLLHLLGSLQWAYPPSDSVKDARRDKGSWFGPARCPLCFTEWNLPAKHAADCGLGNALMKG